MAKPVILDVDPGHDDAVALMLACGSGEFEVLGVTTVAGNVPLAKTTRNALRILSVIGRADIPVAAGASAPLERELTTAEKVHGESGLAGAEIPDAPFEPDERDAIRLMADVLEKSPARVTLVPVGPLTNVAVLLREHPELKQRVAGISLMGGGVGLGNTTPAAEFNIYVDPEAAREVFESGLPITMSGLNVTHQARANHKERERLRSTGRPGEIVADLCGFFAATYKNLYGFDAPPLHDPVAVAAALQPELVETRPMRVDVECEGSLTRGETVCDRYGITGRPPNADVGVELDRESFFDLLYHALKSLDP